MTVRPLRLCHRATQGTSLGLVTVACETPAYDTDETTLIGTCGSRLGPWPDTSPGVQKDANDLAAALGWLLALTVRCPSCVQLGRCVS